jgi:hypothetical protein
MTGPFGDLLAQVSRLLAKGGLWLGVGISVVLAVGSVALVVLVVVHWPADHFKLRVPGAETHPPPARHVLAVIGKNVAGAVLVVLGLLMALPGIPGQGILTMIVGITMIDFPGKRDLERRLIGRPRVLRSINRLRARFQRAPLEMD